MNLFKKSFFKKVEKIFFDTPVFLFSFFKLIFIKVLSFVKNLDTDSIIIVSASDKYFYNSLVQLLDNLTSLNLKNKIIIYDLGLEDWQINELEKYQILYKKFDFLEYPSFISTRDEKNKLGQYAWKPIIIYNTLLDYQKSILWLDTGNIIKNSLKNTFNTIILNGFVSPFSVGKIKDWTHKETLKILDPDSKIRNKRNLTGGFVGFNWENLKARQLAKNWAELSKQEEIIAPKNSSRNNHRQDQSILSIIAYKSNLMRLNISFKYILGIKVNQNPGVKIFNLDRDYDNDLFLLKEEWESINEQNITKTISRSDAVMLLSIDDIFFIPKKYLRKKIIILLINNPNSKILEKHKKYVDVLVTQNKKVYEQCFNDFKVFYEKDIKKIFDLVVKIAKS